MVIGELIEEKRRLKDLSYHKLGVMVGVTGTTVQKWAKGKLSIQKYEHAKALSAALDIDIAEILNDPSHIAAPCARSAPDLPAETTTAPPTIPTAFAGKPVQYNQEFRMSDAIIMATRVLESGTSYATALYLNIQHFDRAIAAEARICQVEETQKSLAIKFDELLLNVDQLRAENQALREENESIRQENKSLRIDINRLKATYENPTGRDGSPTNTENQAM